MRALTTLLALCVLALPLTLALAVHGYDSGSLAVRSTAHELRLLAWAILGGGLLLAGVVACGWAMREVIRAWRTNEAASPERHVYRERIIDGRAPAQNLYLEQPQQTLWPEQVRAAWPVGAANGAAGPQLPAAHDPLQLEAGEAGEATMVAWDAFMPAEHWH